MYLYIVLAALCFGAPALGSTERAYDCSSTLTTGEELQRIQFKTRADFKGSEPHELISISDLDGTRTLIVNAFFADTAHPYIVSTLTCDRAANCSAKLKKFSDRGAVEKPLLISTVPFGVSARLGSVEVLGYRPEGRGFAFQTEKIRIRCSAK